MEYRSGIRYGRRKRFAVHGDGIRGRIGLAAVDEDLPKIRYTAARNMDCMGVTEVASALDYAHSRVSPSGDLSPVIHRDLSPSNIMLSRDGAAKLLDFGVASVAHNREQSLSGTLRGKIRYMSPEQANGNEVSPSTDIWALGIVGIEMLLGRPLFQSMSDLDLLDTVRRGELPEGLKEELRPFQPELGELVLCLRPSPESRPTAEEMQRALNPILSQLTNGAGYTGKDAGRWIQSCGTPVENDGSCRCATLASPTGTRRRNRSNTHRRGSIRRVHRRLRRYFPGTSFLADCRGDGSTSQKWRNLTVQVRILIASVVLLVGFNLLHIG